MSDTNLNVLKNRKVNTLSLRALFPLGMAALLFAIFISNVTGIKLPAIVILALACAIAVICDRSELIAMVVACIPLAAAFQYKYFILAAMAIYIVKFGRDMKYKHGFLPLLFLMALELSHGVFYDFALYEFLRNFAELMVCTLILMCEHKKINYPLIVRTLAISSIVMLSIVLINLFQTNGVNFQGIFAGTYRFGVEDSAKTPNTINYNPNAIGFMANISIAGLLQLSLAKKKHVIDYPMIAVLLFFGLLTLSRTFLIVFALVVILFICSISATPLKKVKITTIIVLLVVSSVFILLKTVPIVIERLISRFMVEDISNGRNDLFAFYNDHIFSSLQYLLYGVGIQNYGDKMLDIHGSYINVCHNGTQEILVCWGLIGLALFTWYIVEMILGTKKDFKRGLINFIPLIITLVDVQSGQLISNGAIVLRLAVCSVSLLWNPKET